MKRPEKNIVVRIVLVSTLLFCVLTMVYVNVKQSDITATSGKKTFVMERGAAVYAADTEKHHAGDYKSGKDVKEITEGTSPTQDTKGYVTPLRILSVIAMSVFLVWYIRRKMKL
ncbi:MAG: hypothetical protein JW743_05870 [Deltaproteobacteria bacterium]|mgnify:CR=1 FL=1|nr:hypothetical protein [Deltaproteobacteria bacterium]MBN2845838.1 hypothetical protein [Deltaproteobacteria bacterium]